MVGLLDVRNFGSVDADHNDLLEQCFRDHEAYHSAVDHRAWLIIGKKGSGKTAIFRRIIHTSAYNCFAFGHTFADYPWSHHAAQASVGVPDEARYQQSWTYLILLTAARILLNEDNSQPWNDYAMEHLASLGSFLIDSYGTKSPRVTDVFSPARRLRIAPHLALPGGWGQLGVNLESLPMPELPRVFQEVNRNIADSVARCVNPSNNYYICFDELDRGFDPGKGDYSSMLSGLLLASRHLNRVLREFGGKMSVIVFLRDDIYDTLRFEDKNKITETSMARVEWDTPRTKWTLRNLMESRFRASLEDTLVSWENLFDESKQMPGHQSKYQYIIDRTFLRPRDIIHYCNDVLHCYQSNESRVERFTNDDVAGAREAYSEYFLNELFDEVPKHLPDLNELLEIVRSIGVSQFDRERFVEHCSSRLFPAERRSDPLSVLEDLFNFSIVAYQKTGGAGGGSEYIWRYMDPRSRFDKDAMYFKVHPGLLEALDLKKYAHKK